MYPNENTFLWDIEWVILQNYYGTQLLFYVIVLRLRVSQVLEMLHYQSGFILCIFSSLLASCCTIFLYATRSLCTCEKSKDHLEKKIE